MARNTLRAGTKAGWPHWSGGKRGWPHWSGQPAVWAQTPGDHPDGICIDAEGAVWYADVGNQHCVRVREGGEVLATVSLATSGRSWGNRRCEIADR